MLLAATPCCAFDNCPDDKTSTEQTSQNTHNQGDEDGCGTCSPFFNCSTCNVSLIATYISVSCDFSPVCLVKSKQAEYTWAIPANNSGAIWQPPKIG